MHRFDAEAGGFASFSQKKIGIEDGRCKFDGLTPTFIGVSDPFFQFKKKSTDFFWFLGSKLARESRARPTLPERVCLLI
jgi:hypothetical protein